MVISNVSDENVRERPSTFAPIFALSLPLAFRVGVVGFSRRGAGSRLSDLFARRARNANAINETSAGYSTSILLI